MFAVCGCSHLKHHLTHTCRKEKTNLRTSFSRKPLQGEIRAFRAKANRESAADLWDQAAGYNFDFQLRLTAPI